MENTYWIVAIIAALLIGGVIGYAIHTQPEADCPTCKTCEVCETCPVVTCPEPTEKIVEKIVYRCDETERANRNVAYVEENGELKEAGSSYSNEQSECARLHDRSLC